MKNEKDRYSHVKSRKQEGSHYTPVELSSFLVKKMIKYSQINKEIFIADPAIGDGELILSILDSLCHKSKIVVYGFDINSDSLKICKDRILTNYPNVELNLFNEDFLNYILNIKNNNQKFDFIIANPPYIRNQNLGIEKSKHLSNAFNIKGSIDIYHAFLIGASKLLKSTGIAGFIVSNRFLLTKSSGNLRQQLYDIYDIHEIYDFGDTKLFEASVLPVVLIFSLKSEKGINETHFSSIYESKSKDIISNTDFSCVDAIEYEGIRFVNDKSYEVKKGKLIFDSNSKDVWRIEDENSAKWLAIVEDSTKLHFSDVGKIRVGVKTTADNVFIKKDWITEEGMIPELLKPLATHHVAGRFKRSSDDLKAILYPHEVVDGKRTAINIDKYEISKKYLERNKEQLCGRNYIQKANRKWYEIWVPQNPDFWSKRKIVFRDISEKPMFWLEDEDVVINGDCYWMMLDNSELPSEILWLVLAVANSSFIEKFYDIKFNNKLYSNKRRYITQYVEKFPLPDPELRISKEMISLAKKIYEAKDIKKALKYETKLNLLVWQSFGFN